MFNSNVVGTLQVTQAFLPALRRSPRATVVVITSIAAEVVYPGGAGYTAAKHAERALAETLRLELNGERVRVVEICPGMVHTDGFSLVRFHGDQSKADAVYDGVDRPLTAADVAECVAFCVGLPQHVNIDRLVVKPVAQAAPHLLHRGPIDWGDDA
jgi:NADP-dependent 3-hydroxy acid dehydrogenase YdfG